MIERRRTHRFLFEAPIELIPVNSHDRIAAITTDIGLKGCFVKTTVLFPAGTILKLRIIMQGRSFAATGEVLYALEQQGMGILFRDVKAKDQAVLEGWLADQNCAPILLRR